jgi:NAD(P)-dependent dehydrogenase (short-subunit alcohol dehydrogenase family)
VRVLVTGAASGIGLAIATRFLVEGARVHIADVSDQAIAAAREQHPSLTATRADVGHPAEVEGLFADATAALRGLDVLVNNCGIAGPAAPLEEVTPEEWDRTIGVNLSGMFYCIRLAVPLFKAQRSGCIINIATTSAKTGIPNRLPYVASKAGVLGLSYNVARELGRWNIRCNAILPGLVDNPRGRGIVRRLASERGVPVDQVEQDFLAHISMRTWVSPDEIAQAAVFLASDRARHITGQQIAVDGNVEWEA